MLSSKIILIERKQQSADKVLLKNYASWWADSMTVMRIDDKSSDSSVSPNIQPEQASVKPPNQFAFKSVQIFAHSLFGEMLDVTHDIIV